MYNKKQRIQQRRLVAACVAAALLGPMSLPAVTAQSSNLQADAEKYNACLALAENAPDRGINMALEWQLADGGVPARHCEAVGLFFAREYSEAAVRLEGIAEDMRIGRGMPVRGDERATANASMLADTYGQAANAWLLGGELVRAESAIVQALSLVPEHSALERDLRVDRSRIAAADEDFTLALSELEAVWAVDRQRFDILILLASAARGIENYSRAQSALKTYMATYPDDPAAFLELGNLHDAQGDKAAARQAWLKTLALEETGPNADAARANLERIDVAK
mgnify:CR=1 FL=1